ncbi:restriction endonuclease subunit S [uncultured Akkermansia sp.]|uniref:restriction endonuclease subunit S n=1 Tax=uncultured Akkermansia sp. TaxID=512294 RepID=UPI00260FD141|nr:restriction endonuclease subunit S [uncultured Akkermansia sp.]
MNNDVSARLKCKEWGSITIEDKMDIKKLRQKILDLAIHGKLVPQDPNDEPASVLLQRIREEKEKLIKEGKIKKRKKSTNASDMHHYQQVLPNGWCLSTLGEVFTLQAGKNITAKDIKDTATELHSYKCYGGNGIRGFVASYNREGDFPIIGRQGALCGNINIAKGKFYATEHAVVVERYCDVDLMWAYYTLTTLNLNQYATATAQPGLSVAVINDVYIPVPPLKEQERISQEIEHWFALIDQIEQGKADLQTTIKQAKSKILDLAIHGKLVQQDPNDEPAIELLKRINPDFTPCDNGQYGNIPHAWVWVKLGHLFDAVSAKRVMKSDWKTKGIPFYRAREIVKLSDYNEVNNELFIDNEHYNELKNKYGVPVSGDIMLSAVGTIGKSYIVKSTDKFYYKDASVLCLRNYNRLNSKFFSMLFSTSFLQYQMAEYSKGTTVDTITLEKLKSYIVPLPPLAEQQRIVQKIEELFSVLDNIQKALEV